MLPLSSLLNPNNSPPATCSRSPPQVGFDQPRSFGPSSSPAAPSVVQSSPEIVFTRPTPTEPQEYSKREKGEVNYPPYDNLDNASYTEARRFQVHPLGRVQDNFTRIPYNAGKRDFFEKTGRDCFEVFQYTFKVPDDETTYKVMWDYTVGLVRITPFFKCCKYSKTMPARMLSLNPGLKEITHSITGGSVKAQGYWMPFDCAEAVCATFCNNVSGALIPIFGPNFPAKCIKSGTREYGHMVISPEIIARSTEKATHYRYRYGNKQQVYRMADRDTPPSSPKRALDSPHYYQSDDDRNQNRFRKPLVTDRKHGSIRNTKTALATSLPRTPNLETRDLHRYITSAPRVRSDPLLPEPRFRSNGWRAVNHPHEYSSHPYRTVGQPPCNRASPSRPSTTEPDPWLSAVPGSASATWADAGSKKLPQLLPPHAPTIEGRFSPSLTSSFSPKKESPNLGKRARSSLEMDGCGPDGDEYYDAGESRNGDSPFMASALPSRAQSHSQISPVMKQAPRPEHTIATTSNILPPILNPQASRSENIMPSVESVPSTSPLVPSIPSSVCSSRAGSCDIEGGTSDSPSNVMLLVRNAKELDKNTAETCGQRLFDSSDASGILRRRSPGVNTRRTNEEQERIAQRTAAFALLHLGQKELSQREESKARHQQDCDGDHDQSNCHTCGYTQDDCNCHSNGSNNDVGEASHTAMEVDENQESDNPGYTSPSTSDEKLGHVEGTSNSVICEAEKKNNEGCARSTSNCENTAEGDDDKTVRVNISSWRPSSPGLPQSPPTSPDASRDRKVSIVVDQRTSWSPPPQADTPPDTTDCGSSGGGGSWRHRGRLRSAKRRRTTMRRHVYPLEV